MSIFFTADHHFDHVNIILYCNRPFDSIERMNEALIANWNKVVKKNDTVYHLGDFGFFNNKLAAKKIFDALNGKIILLRGSHDRDKKIQKSSRFAMIRDRIEMKIDGKLIVLSHYPMLSWRASFHGSWHLFGHVHGKLQNPPRNSLDVGVDCWDYAPVSFETIKEKLTQQQSKKWYLAGPISFIDEQSAMAWRQEAKQHLQCIDPFEEEDKSLPGWRSTAKQKSARLRAENRISQLRREIAPILKVNKESVQKAFGILAYCPGGVPIWGTTREIVLAHELNKPIVIWTPLTGQGLSEIMIGMSTVIVHSLKAAIQECRRLEEFAD